MEAFLQEAKASSRVISTLSGADKNRILKEMATALRVNTMDILKANTLDMEDAEANNLAASLKDRLFLDESRVDGMAVANSDFDKAAGSFCFQVIFRSVFWRRPKPCLSAPVPHGN